MTRRRLPRVAFGALVVLLYVFLLAPIAVVVIASLNAGRFLVFPPEGLSLQWYAKFAKSGPFVRSFGFSLRLAAVATVISTVVGAGPRCTWSAGRGGARSCACSSWRRFSSPGS